MKTKIIDTLRSAVQKLGVLAVGEELNQSEYRDCLVALNRVVDNYSTNGIFIGHTIDVDLPAPLDENNNRVWKREVTFGNGGDYDAFDPIEFVALAFRESGGTDYRLESMSENDFANISYKNITAIPKRAIFKKVDGGLSKLYFDAIPQDGLRLVGSAKVKYTGTNSKGEPFNANDEVEWDEGIEAMMVYRTALELAPDYGVKDVSLVASMLDDIEQKVLAQNSPQLTMEVEAGFSQPYGYGSNIRNRARY